MNVSKAIADAVKGVNGVPAQIQPPDEMFLAKNNETGESMPFRLLEDQQIVPIIKELTAVIAAQKAQKAQLEDAIINNEASVRILGYELERRRKQVIVPATVR